MTFKHHKNNHHKNRHQENLLLSSSSSLLLLCQRWVVGICTTRHGRIAHQEPFLIEYSTPPPPPKKKQPPQKQTLKQKNVMLRFRGTRHGISGSFSTCLSHLLTPLLRIQHPQQEEQHEQQDESSRSTSLLELHAEALLEEDGIQIGGEVPIQLT